MTHRRGVLSATACLGLFSLSGCLDSVTGGGDGSDGTEGDDQRREIVRTYDDAIVARNDATTARDEGVTAFNEESYSPAIESIESALADYESATEGFSEAADVAHELTEDTAAALCETAATETD
ncbi:hypothetical protein ACFQDD_06685, partial [Halorubrum pallidum]